MGKGTIILDLGEGLYQVTMKYGKRAEVGLRIETLNNRLAELEEQMAEVQAEIETLIVELLAYHDPEGETPPDDDSKGGEIKDPPDDDEGDEDSNIKKDPEPDDEGDPEEPNEDDPPPLTGDSTIGGTITDI